MNTFKLLAIRPLVDCQPNFLKNLTTGYIYKFHQNYDYYDGNHQIIDAHNATYQKDEVTLLNSVKHIKKREISDGELFDIQNKDGRKISMNVSALVGKNGSGKSTLLELLYAMCYVIALRKGIIDDHSKLSKRLNQPNSNKAWIIEKMNDIQFFYKDFQAEIFYEVNGDIYCIRWGEPDLTHHFFGGTNAANSAKFPNGFYHDKDEVEEKEKFLLNELLFYTIAINYSLYGLNTESDNRWLQDLFHKNDGYQTPLVINPYRIEGNIDVNNELHLAQTRLLLNIFKTDSEEFSLVNDKKVNLVAFELNYKKFNTFRNINLDNVIQIFKEKYNISDQEFFEKVFTTFYDQDSIQGFDITTVKNHNLLLKYLYRKIFKIAFNYKEYRDFIEIPKEGRPIPVINNFFDQLKELKEDRSHITLKLLQVLNIIRYDFFAEDNEYQWQVEENLESKDGRKETEPIRYFTVSFEELIKRIERIYKGREKYELEEFIPAACVIPRLAVETAGESSNFEIMSSGEQHFIHSMQSIFYHLKNIDSVFASAKDKIKYRYINLALDEIELYFHPEFQRNYIHELRKGIRQLDLQHITGINVLLSTNSPFILSDIPHTNILKMDNGKADGFRHDERTFGANIHDLLKNDFFLKKSFMGEQARETITSLITFLQDTSKNGLEVKWDKHSAKACIELIGEPILRNTLRELYFEHYKDQDQIDEEIARLQQLKRNNDRNS